MPRRSSPLPRGTSQLRRTGFRVRLSEGEVGGRTRIKPRSTRRAAEERAYLRLRKDFLDGALCARCGTTEDLTVQHLHGRVGADLCDVGGFLSLCWPCHSYATEHPAEAIASGWAESRLSLKEPA